MKRLINLDHDPDPPAQFMWTSLVVGVVCIGVVVVMAVAS